MIAINVEEAQFLLRRVFTTLLSAERVGEILRAEIADIRLDGGVALAREAEPRAMRVEQIEQAVVRPVERVDAERMLARRQAERHRNEKAALERADLRDVARDAKLALAADDMAADRGGKR